MFEKFFISLSVLNDDPFGESILNCKVFPFRTLNISCNSFLACNISSEKSAYSLIVVPLYLTLCLSLLGFRIIFFFFYHYLLKFNYISGMDLFEFFLFGSFYVSYSWISVSFFWFGNFLAITCSNTFSTPFSLLLLETIYCGCWNTEYILEISYVAFDFFLFICLSFCCSDWVIFLKILSSGSLMHSSLSFNLLSLFLECFYLRNSLFLIRSFFIVSSSLLKWSMLSSILFISSVRIFLLPAF